MLKFLPILLSICLMGCACPGTYYHPRDREVGLGYSDTQLSANTWEVSYQGCDIPQSEVRDYVLLRAAWLCSKNGYPWFSLKEQSNVAPVLGVSYGQIGTSVTYPESSITVHGLKSQIPGALNSAFLLSSLTRKYRISESSLR